MARFLAIGVSNAPSNLVDGRDPLTLCDQVPDISSRTSRASRAGSSPACAVAAAERRGLAQYVPHLSDDLVAVALPLQPVGKQDLLKVAVAFVVLPMTEVGIAECVGEECDDSLLGEDFPLADVDYFPSPDA
jgi:hypothetical protein